MNRIELLLTFVMAFATTAFAEGNNPTLKIFVTPRLGADGFVESPRAVDSAKDIRENLAKRKGVIIVQSEKDAELTVEVVYSGLVAVGTTSNTNLSRGIFGGISATTSTSEKTLPSIGIQLHVRGSEATKDIVVTSQMFWKDLAKAAASQTIDWCNTNWVQLQKVLGK